MNNTNESNARSSADDELAVQFDQKTSMTEVELLNKQRALKDLEDSLRHQETALAQRALDLKAAQEEVSKQQADLACKLASLAEQELQAKNGFLQLFEERFAVFKKQLEQREFQCAGELESIESEKDKLRRRELAVQKAEIQRDNGYTDERAKLDAEFSDLRKKQETELEFKRLNSLEAIDKEISETRKSKLASLEKELADRLNAHEASVQKEMEAIAQDKESIRQNQGEHEKLKDDLEFQKQRLQSRQDALLEREANLKAEVEDIVFERKKSFESEKSTLIDEISRLRESIKTSSALIFSFEELKQKLNGEEPAAVLLKLKTYEEEIRILRDDLATRPTQEMRGTCDRLKSERDNLQSTCERLIEENNNFKNSARAQSDLEMRLDELSDEKTSWQRRYEAVDADNSRLSEELRRIQASYEREQDREARIRDIETPYLQKELPRLSDEIEELQWLDNINKACIDYGLRFPRRILHAFHTALKTSEWSPLTVLAGVSGTGKSELPRLYSHFGGLNFLNLSVQPNWDSQESMLGFFNSIDNKFDAQPVLRLLAQSQKAPNEDYPAGLKDAMTLILMDEMNLSHIELYFAEFLSKLELRRGLSRGDVPCLEVKLGAGLQHYDLPLGRNVLWAGTMNQDETTKSLSDKVLDRGIVITFPRPTTLERRNQLKALGKPSPLLPLRHWQRWWRRDSLFSDDHILPFKSFIEEVNASLAKVGRALGHRVWQSIEYYMGNYPDVSQAQDSDGGAGLAKAMKIAFEDQLVQKVMPKLRGIETRGKSRSDCLDKIRAQLVNGNYAIVDDFDMACEFGYGQFIWNSASYLKNDDSENSES